MKKYMVLLLAAILLLIGSGCQLEGLAAAIAAAEHDADDTLSALLEAVASEDSAAATALFSENARREMEDVPRDVASMLDYLQGNRFDYLPSRSPSVEQTWERDGSFREMESASYDISSETQTYRLAMRVVTVDTAHQENVGIWSLSLIRAEEDPQPDYAYAGDCTYQTGIHIGAKCEPVTNGDPEVAEALSIQTVTDLLDAAVEGDRAAASALFAENAVETENFPQTLENLMDCFADGYVTFAPTDAVELSYGCDADGQWRETGVASFLVQTAQGDYRLDIRQVYYNTTTPEDIGLWLATVTPCAAEISETAS